MKNILYIYNGTQTFTNAVYEHINSFSKYSSNNSFFCHQDANTQFNVDLSCFDAVGIHFSVRLPYDQLSKSLSIALSNFKGLKFLFIQDEYDHVHRTWWWIKFLGLHLVFTVVPKNSIEIVYPPSEFPNTRFVANFTGYIPDDLVLSPNLLMPSQREIVIGYRGRPLPVRYGKLGFEKIEIGRIFKEYCTAHNVKNDIEWNEESRIYGKSWYDFMLSCRSMLGCESGSNVFDWDGTLVTRINERLKNFPSADEKELYEIFVKPVEMEGIMNQISPRIFESIAAKTVLVLFEGGYSGVITAGEHFISVKKDGSNLAEVISSLENLDLIDRMVDRAYQDVIASGRYSYKSFVAMVDQELDKSMTNMNKDGHPFPLKEAIKVDANIPTPITTMPIRSQIAKPLFVNNGFMRFGTCLWQFAIPETLKIYLRPKIKYFLNKA